MVDSVTCNHEWWVEAMEAFRFRVLAVVVAEITILAT